MHRTIILGIASLGIACVVAPAPQPAAAQLAKGKHPRVHRALRDLRLARLEMKEGADVFGGHRVKAAAEVEQAINLVDKALRSVGETIAGTGRVDPGVYKRYDTFPHMQHALRLLRDAHADLKAARTDFNGLRVEALAATDRAILAVERGLAFAANKK